MKRSIQYFCHFDTPQNLAYNRHYALSASQKIEYLFSKLNHLDFNVDIISLSSTRNPRSYLAQRMQINDKTTVQFFPTLQWGNKIRRFCSRLFMSYNILLYGLRHLKRNDTVLLYHTLEYANILYRVFKFFLNV